MSYICGQSLIVARNNKLKYIQQLRQSIVLEIIVV